VTVVSANASSASRSSVAPWVASTTNTDSYATPQRCRATGDRHHHFIAGRRVSTLSRDFAETPKRRPCFGNARLKLRVGVQPGLENEPEVMHGHWSIAEPFRETRTLEHQWDSAIIGVIKQRGSLGPAPDRDKQPESHVAQLLGVRTQRVGECQEARQRRRRVATRQREGGSDKFRHGTSGRKNDAMRGPDSRVLTT
jgi:hypothetical protein